MKPRVAYGASIGLLFGVNVGSIWLPGWVYVPLNIAVGAALLAVAARGGATSEDLGTRRDVLKRGLVVGAILGIVIVLAVAAGAALPATRGWFDDDRAAGIGVGGCLYQVLIRIPIGTALFEEVAFRGALVGLGRQIWSRAGSTAVASLLFGLWHIVPSLALADSNAAAGQTPVVIVVILAVLGTAAAGWAFTWLRDRASSLAAPALAHAILNSAAFAAAWVILP